MSNQIRFLLVLHNHQPVGNFDHVFEQAFQDSYRPFLEVFEPYEALKISLHISGSLMEWLVEHHPEYLDQLARLVSENRVEMIGGPFYEPILAMLPSRDRVGQIRRYTRWLEERFSTSIRGMWMPERVWEQSYTRDLVDAGIEYTLLDDYHFKNSGLDESQLTGHFVTEDDGRVFRIFPGSEQLRYLIPFGSPQQTIDYLGEIAQRDDEAVIAFGDDGEKFGTWPETHDHVYRDRWLHRFFDALVANQDWIRTTTISEAVDHVAPKGKIYLPDSSYREMTEWALPYAQLSKYEQLKHEMKDDPRWEGLKQFVRGGFWRNFKIKYSEADEMYSRMMAVSCRLQDALDTVTPGEPIDRGLLEKAKTELYRAQCNCAYWHGAFGGIYLPHLRNAIYQHLIAADNLLDRAAGRPEAWVEANVDDFNFDTCPEIQLANDKLLALVAPHRGGQLYELDVRSIEHNLLATFTRHPEAYHQKILSNSNDNQQECASIHDRIVCKQEGLDQRIQYDAHARKSLLDHFYDPHVTLDAVVSGEASEQGDFIEGRYTARVRRNPDRIQVQLSREGQVSGAPVKLTKGLTLNAGSSELEIAYLLEGLSQDKPLHFSVEFNFAGLPAGADDRYFLDTDQNRLGQLGTRLDLADANGLGLVDEWLGIGVALAPSRPTHFWTFPIETVSQSEGGFELVHQSVVVQPHWNVVPDAEGRWSITMRLSLESLRSENHKNDIEQVATS